MKVEFFSNNIVIKGRTSHMPYFISRYAKEWKLNDKDFYIGRVDGAARISKNQIDGRLKYYFCMNSVSNIKVNHIQTWCRTHGVDPCDWEDEDILAFTMETDY